VRVTGSLHENRHISHLGPSAVGVRRGDHTTEVVRCTYCGMMSICPLLLCIHPCCVPDNHHHKGEPRYDRNCYKSCYLFPLIDGSGSEESKHLPSSCSSQAPGLSPSWKEPSPAFQTRGSPRILTLLYALRVDICAALICCCF
jgi:hypothetical protein